VLAGICVKVKVTKDFLSSATFLLFLAIYDVGEIWRNSTL